MGEYSIKDESAREQAATRLARRVIRLGRKVNSMKIARPVCPYPSILIQPEAHPPRVRRPWQLPFFRGLSLKKKKRPPPPPLSPPLSSFSFRTLILLSRPFNASNGCGRRRGGCHEKSLLIVGSPTWGNEPPPTFTTRVT